MTAHFIKNGNKYTVSPKGVMEIEDTLPPLTFSLKNNPMTGFYLEVVESFTLPSKVYGDTLKLTDRILYTFSQREKATGVFLVGEKGSGKTLLARSLSIEGVKRQIPTIVINSAFSGDQFNSFIQSIAQPCIILFDEFEKIYDQDSQERILTLLDGVFPSQKLFVLTSNDKYKIDNNMRNRPGRIYYFLEFKGLNKEFIVEYCRDNLGDQSKVEDLVKVSNLFDSFNFDLLSAFVEELNRYNEGPFDLLPLLNAKPEYCNGKNYLLRNISYRGTPIPLTALNAGHLKVIGFNLSSGELRLSCNFCYKEGDSEVSNKLRSGAPRGEYNFNPEEVDIIGEMIKSGEIWFKSHNGKGKSPSTGLFGRLSPQQQVALGDLYNAAHRDQEEGSTQESDYCISLKFYPEDIVSYTSGGAKYENEEGFSLEVKETRGKGGNSSLDVDW